MRNWMKRAVPAALVAGSLLALAAGAASAAPSPLGLTSDLPVVTDVVANTTSVLGADQGRSLGPEVPGFLSNIDTNKVSLSGQQVGGAPTKALPKLPVTLPVGLPGDQRSMDSLPGVNFLDLGNLANLAAVTDMTGAILPDLTSTGPLAANHLSGVDQVSGLTTLPAQSDARSLPVVPAVPSVSGLTAVPSLSAVTGLLNKGPKLGS